MRIGYSDSICNNSVTDGLIGIINNIMQYGDVAINLKDTTIREFNDALVVECPSSIDIPYMCAFNNDVVKKISPKFALAEAAYILQGRDDCGIVDDFPFMERYKQSGVMIGAYGPYFKKQLSDTIYKLMRDNATRQAVITVWPIDDNFRRSDLCVDVPCTNYFAFYIDRIAGYKVLNMTVVHRSSDVLLGLMYDIVFQQLLLQTVALFLDDVYLGAITNIAVNRHIYLNGSGIYALNNVDGDNIRNIRAIALDKKNFSFVNFINAEVFNKQNEAHDFFSVRESIKELFNSLLYKDISLAVNKIMSKLYKSVIDGSYKKYLYENNGEQK